MGHSIPKLKKTEWPVHVTDALGIPSIQGRGGPWHSTGDTTDVAWFHAICDFLGIEYPGERIRAMRAIIEAVGGTWDQARHSSAVDGKTPGGNVRKEAFEDLWEALHTSGILDDADRPALAADSLTHSTTEALPEPRWSYQHIRLRLGQPGFRRRLLDAYDGKCTVTASDINEVLEAAHIRSHSSGGTMATSNGLLLRADLHTLFDLRLLAVDTQTWTVLLHPRLRSTSLGKEVHGVALRLPEDAAHRPSPEALNEHRARCGF